MPEPNVVCRHCSESNFRRHGTTESGKQRYFCKACARSFVQDVQQVLYSQARKDEILRAYDERSSLRGLSRIFGVSRNTVSSWLKKSS